MEILGQFSMKIDTRVPGSDAKARRVNPAARNMSRTVSIPAPDSSDGASACGRSLQGEAMAEHGAARRVAAQERVQQRKARASRKQRLALSCPARKFGPGWNQSRRRKGLMLPGFLGGAFRPPPPVSGAAKDGRIGSGSGRITGASMNPSRRFVTAKAEVKRWGCQA
jgi:hypothetical protein